MTTPPDTAAAGRRSRGATVTHAPAPHPPQRARDPRHRPGTTLGARRGPARVAHRRGRRPRPVLHRYPPGCRQVTTGKTFDAWDTTLPSIPSPTQTALRTLEWVGRRENLVVCGPSGTGKTMFLEALGHDAVAAGTRSRASVWRTSASSSARHRADDSVTRANAPILRTDLIVVDNRAASRSQRSSRRPLPPGRRRLERWNRSLVLRILQGSSTLPCKTPLQVKERSSEVEWQPDPHQRLERRGIGA